MLRKIAQYGVPGVMTRVYRDTEWDEFVVKPPHAANPASWYHTSDKQDACDTARSISASSLKPRK